ncbi:MAG TPA: glycosyltransferase [Longimicrobiaceae bacterium]|nr:glycosyltransferase [Longimicrobiaceae bacterium]
MFVAAHNAAHVWGGLERATSLLLAGLARRGHRVLLFCNDARVAEGARALGVPAEVLVLGGDAMLHHAARFARRLGEDRPDALVISSFQKVWLGGMGARLAGVPRVVARIGLENYTPYSWKYRLAFGRWVDAVVVNAARMRPPFLALPGWSEARVATIHNGVWPRPRSAPGGLRRELGIPEDAPVVGAMARLARQKRLDRLLHALALLPPGVHCLVAGEGPERQALAALAAELGLGARVHFLGFREDVGDVLEALDLLLVTSDTEGLSNTMLEALAAGVPVVSTPVSGADEALDPLPDGRRPGLVVGFTPEEVAAAVRELLADPARRAGMGSAARERAEERFGFERMLDRWEAVLGAPGGGGDA